MSIPIDRLYHYIDSIAQEIYKDDIVIYRFYPHGSKKIENLTPLKPQHYVTLATKIQVYCNDQEPLNHLYYQQTRKLTTLQELNKKYNISLVDRNFMSPTIYNKAILLHSEQRSADIEKYYASEFLPAYYWSHALIALDWFRYAQHETFNKQVTKKFLIYNRAWAGTREYRLKFIDLLIAHKLHDQCWVSFNPIDPEANVSYTNHTYANNSWRPSNVLENFISAKQVDSSASADYEASDYNTTDIEVVLETLFDDNRLHLTEKILRPIACGQPFLLAATHGSLAYLRSYGFKTFDGIIDESYDAIEDPALRLASIVNAMKIISNWSESERQHNMKMLNEIAAYNRKHFFSVDFFKTVTAELRLNLEKCIIDIDTNDKCSRYVEYRKKASQYPEIKEVMLTLDDRKTTLQITKEARKRYQRTN
jgi:hypothetical protein